MKRVWTIALLALLAACKKDDPPMPPEQVTLVFPGDNSECTTGVDLGNGNSRVEFSWRVSGHTENYEIRVTNIATGDTETLSTQMTSASLPLEQGTPYSWLVLSRNSQVAQVSRSDTWLFYNAGPVDSHIPFPAKAIYPTSGSSVFINAEGKVSLQWSTSDLDGDIAKYQVFFDTSSPPNTLFEELSDTKSSVSVPVSSGKVYYWKVLTIDSVGNVTDSGVFSFKAL